MCRLDRRAVASPIIDVISDENFAYLTGSEESFGGFNEKLNFRWYPIPMREKKRRGYDKSVAARFVYSTYYSTNQNSINKHLLKPLYYYYYLSLNFLLYFLIFILNIVSLQYKCGLFNTQV